MLPSVPPGGRLVGAPRLEGMLCFRYVAAWRLAMASKDFDELCRIWKHARMSLQKKVRIFESCVVSRL
eukprot:5970979-Pyramimonas_sp.AAC.1